MPLRRTEPCLISNASATGLAVEAAARALTSGERTMLMLAGEGLHPTSKGARVRFDKDGNTTVVETEPTLPAASATRIVPLLGRSLPAPTTSMRS